MSDKCPHCGSDPNEHRPQAWICGTHFSFEDYAETVSPLCRERAAHAETRREFSEVAKEREALKVKLRAWQSVFGTTQLTHALARMDEAEKAVKRFRAKWERLREWAYTYFADSERNPVVVSEMNRLDAEEKEGK